MTRRLPFLLELGLSFTALLAAVSPPVSAESPWSGVETSRFKLVAAAEGYRLEERNGTEPPTEIPRTWLASPAELAADEQAYVSSSVFDEQVQSFPIGGGRLGVHLSSYEIQDSGSAQAAAGRDVFLVFEPSTRRLSPGGLDLGVTKSRVRLGGCFAATHHQFLLGDIDGDRRLDIGVVEERVACDLPEIEGPGDEARGAALRFLPAWSIEPVEWHVQTGEGWRREPLFDGRLPAFAYRELPLLGLEMSPVDFVLGLKRRGALPISAAPGRGEP